MNYKGYVFKIRPDTPSNGFIVHGHKLFKPNEGKFTVVGCKTENGALLLAKAKIDDLSNHN